MPRIPARTWACALACVLACGVSPATADDAAWFPVPASDLARSDPVVEPGADAEALFWDVHVEDQNFLGMNRWSTELWHYLRIKVFTERGRESQATVTLPYGGAVEVADIEGRTIAPDGRIVPLRPQDVFDRVVVRARGLREHVKTFVMPAVTVGAVIEYHWREVRHSRLSFEARYELQRDIPVRVVTYHFMPLKFDGRRLALRTEVFNATPEPRMHDHDGFDCVSLVHVPAFHAEPRMPPEHEVRPWLLVFYEDVQPQGQAFWEQYAQYVDRDLEPLLESTPALRRAAAEAVGDTAHDEAHLRRLYDFCQTRIRNISADATGLDADELRRLAEDGGADVTLHKREGTAHDVNLLFAALARAAGFEAEIALVGDRSEEFFDASRRHHDALGAHDVAVRVGGRWRVFDPGTARLPFGRLVWEEEGQPALVAKAARPCFVDVPASPAESSCVTRVATMSLAPDGTLEGDARFAFTGHDADDWKRSLAGDSPAQVEDAVRAFVQSDIADAAVTEVQAPGATEPRAPVRFGCHLRVPAYAQVAGHRLFVAPALFERAREPVFPDSARRYPICIDFARARLDTVRLALPRGARVDALPEDASFAVADSGAFVATVRLAAPDTLLLVRARRGCRRVSPVSAYAAIRRDEQQVREVDTRTVSVRLPAATGATGSR